jgi:hypothetical protein
MNCPECNTKMRKFKEGVICNKNHKFVEGSKIYDVFYNTNTYINPKLLCSKCGEKGRLYSFDETALQCKNEHTWGI